MASKLPVEDVLPQVMAALQQHGAVVLQAPTGSGKTTRVSPALLKHGLLGSGTLLLLQPRRVAARACARAMAQLMGEQVGQSVGYQIRFERKLSRDTRVIVVTEGILTRRFADDPMLEGVSCVVLDEFHERSLHGDLALAFIHELRSLRDDLKVVVMSATLDAEPVAGFLGDCPVITAEGRQFPLEIRYLPTSPGQDLSERVALGLQQLIGTANDDGGNILVFLPGAGEIRRCQTYLSQKGFSAELVPLHGSLSSKEQDEALRPGSARRIILATNIAETSLTIEGVTAVVDTGFHKQMLFDPTRGSGRLDQVRISQASAAQRAGRAGRTAPGRVIRLWSEEHQAVLQAAEPPEIARADLSNLMLSVLDFHGPDLASFPFFEPPPEQALDRATWLLRLLGAIASDGRITELGRKLSSLPLDPRVGAMFHAAAQQGRLREAAILAALLGERAPRGLSDLFTIYQAYQAREPKWEPRTMRRLNDSVRQLLDQSARLWPEAERAIGALTREQAAQLLLAGYPDRVCRHRSAGQGVMVGGRGVALERGPGESSPDYFLALELVERGRDRTAAKVDLMLPVNLANLESTLDLSWQERAQYDEGRGAVTGVKQLLLGDLVLREKPARKVSPEAIADVLAEHAAKNFSRFFNPDKEVAALCLRMRFAARHLPEEGWPDVSEAGLIRMLPTLCLGRQKLDELKRLDWKQVLLGQLTYGQRSLLDKEVPERIAVPSGSQVRIDYAPAFEDTGYPVLAVRLQEMFGMLEPPRIARGRVPLLCHLLAPNMRPAQVTRDLHNFWHVTYKEVRKELRQRYPKHSWPEDPLTAQAIRGVPRKKK